VLLSQLYVYSNQIKNLTNEYLVKLLGCQS